MSTTSVITALPRTLSAITPTFNACYPARPYRATDWSHLRPHSRSVADQTSEQAQGGVPLRGFRDPEQRKGIPRLYQTFVRDH